MSCRRVVSAAVLAALSLAGPLVGSEVEGVAPQEARARLEAGNTRYTTSKVNPRKYRAERPALAEGQKPYAMVLSCADSRVPPEIVFDESLGKLFVVRLAGNVADADALASLEYAAEHLGPRFLIVLGHSSCGAVKAAVGGAEGSANLNGLIKEIKPAAEAARKSGAAEKALLGAAVEENVKLQIKNISERSDVLKGMLANGHLEIAGAVYDLKSGKVSWIPAP